MKAENNIMPDLQFEILPLSDNEVEILFYENIETIPPKNEEDSEKYSYDCYRLIVRNRENLAISIEANYETWLEMAKKKEVRETLCVPLETDRLSALEDAMNFVLGL